MRIGIDLGGTKIVGVTLDGGRELERVRVDTPRDYRQTIEAIAGVVSTLESRIPGPQSRPSPVGVGIPGTISRQTGRVKNANSTWLIGHTLMGDLERRLGRAVRIANDANCFAMSEAADGAAAGADVVFGVIAGTGVGGGVVVRGSVLEGANGIAGEWGHNPLPWPASDEMPGLLCYCGRRGCIETFLSGPALSLDHERANGIRLSPPEIAKRAEEGEPAAEESMSRYEHRMARALATVINLLDPDVIVLGGGMSNIERLYLNVPRVWERYVFAAEDRPASGDDASTRGDDPRPSVGTRLARARHGDSSGVRGAAWLWPGEF